MEHGSVEVISVAHAHLVAAEERLSEGVRLNRELNERVSGKGLEQIATGGAGLVALRRQLEIVLYLRGRAGRRGGPGHERSAPHQLSLPAKLFRGQHLRELKQHATPCSE